jgi:hypothetical protein
LAIFITEQFKPTSTAAAGSLVDYDSAPPRRLHLAGIACHASQSHTKQPFAEGAGRDKRRLLQS